MPATEQTWRNQARLDVIFAITGVLMLLATLLMFYRDHERPWKKIQPVAVNLEQKMTDWRKAQYQTHDAIAKHDKLQQELLVIQSTPIAPELMEKFIAYAGGAGPATLGSSDDSVGKPKPKPAEDMAKRSQDEAVKVRDGSFKAFQDEAAKAADARATKAADMAAVEQRAAALRKQFIGDLNDIVIKAKVKEDQTLDDRKFASAYWDEKKANVDLGVRDNVGAEKMKQLEDETTAAKAKVDSLTDAYQALGDLRKNMDRVVKEINAPVDAAQKAIADNQADLVRLEQAFVDRRETYVVWWGPVPLPGKEILNFPILDAFGTRRRVDNLWAEGLEQDYNFRKVRRFDRCTTCHQLMQKSVPGQPTDPAYPEQVEFDLVLRKAPPPDVAATPPAEGQPVSVTPVSTEVKKSKIEELNDYLLNDLGLMLASEGLISLDDVTVKYVRPDSAAAKASLGSGVVEKKNGEEWLSEVRKLKLEIGEGPHVEPGLMVGDVIAAVNGSKIFAQPQSGRELRAAALGEMIRDELRDSDSVRLTIYRGVPNPYATHPRLDLFVGDNSPHAMGKFACTICHDGQGSATEFKWASHAPNTPDKADEWQSKYGWFDNHHWIYPMYPKRFAESACLKCHHNVVELEPSEKFTTDPAPKVVHGYYLIQKYGCFGCHEINGFDGPNKRVGPDLRLEPNYFAVAQQLLHFAGKNSDNGDTYASLRGMAQELVRHPEDNDARHDLQKLIDEDALAKDKSVLPAEVHSLSGLLKDVEVPGKLRKVGPSLRYAAQKLDETFLYDWIKNPRNFRPDTRMPRFFGLWKHLENHDTHKLPAAEEQIAPRYEPIEIRGIMAYLENESQDYEPLTPPEGIAESTPEEQISRGKRSFETRGCLACHNHKEFPDIAHFRKGDAIVQGPDLSGVGAKFNEKRNPKGPGWLYSWIREPTRYHARTVMPVTFVGPEEIADPKFEAPADDPTAKAPLIKIDSAADIAAYLLSVESDWEIDPQAEQAVDQAALKELTQRNLEDGLALKAAARYVEYGIPSDMAAEFKGAEKELLVARADYEAKKPLSDEQRLRYIGKKTIAKYGCYACHDIPGFEDAKPIGTGLADWGRKDPAKLAFEHITHYLEHGHGHAAQGHSGHDDTRAGHGTTSVAEHIPAADSVTASKAPAAAAAEDDGFYEESIHHSHRSGFIYQKLKEPRSYDYKKTENKKYSERLRMPEFPFNHDEREAVVTFVLGLVADPPTAKYVYQPKARDAAIQAGKVVWEKYNCGGCHVAEAEKLKLTFTAGDVNEPNTDVDFSFLINPPATPILEALAKPDRRGMFHGEVRVLPQLSDGSARSVVLDVDNSPLDEATDYQLSDIRLMKDMYGSAVLGGKFYRPGAQTLKTPLPTIEEQVPMRGGVLTRYLQPRVLEIEQETNPNAKGSQAWGWLPPPLIGEGSKVQSEWLRDFLLNPYPIRPAVFLRMPKFNMSPAEAETLAAYFAAVDNADYPSSNATRRNPARLQAKEDAYRKTLETAGKMPEEGTETARFDDAMKVVTHQKTYCAQCHIIGDFKPTGSPRGHGPNLTDVHRRMRPDYLRNWIARPTYYLPYTPMPVNVHPTEGLKEKGLIEGTPEEQVDALVDILMNYDVYAQRKLSISKLIPPPMGDQQAPTTDAPAADAGRDNK